MVVVRAGSPATPGNEQGIFSHVLHWLGAGSAFMPQSQLSHDVASSAQPSDINMSAWHLVLTDLCCCRAMIPDTCFNGTTGQDATMVPGGITGYLTPRCPSLPSSLQSPVLSLFIVSHLLVCFSFPFLHHLLVPLCGASESLGLPQDCS